MPSSDRPVPNLARNLLLAEALQLCRSLANPDLERELRQRQQERLGELQSKLTAFAHPIADQLPAVETIPLSVRQAFVEAIALLSRYPQLGSQGWQGTLASPTLSQYQLGTIDPRLGSAAAIAQLCQQFQLPPAFGHQVTQLLTTVDRQGAQQQQIIQAVLVEAGLAPDPNQVPRTAILALFQQLFGALPIPAAALDCLYTSTQLYFCLDYDRGQLRDPELWQSLSAVEQHQISQFLAAIASFSFQKFRHFPTFSLCDPGQINPDWTRRLAHQTGLSQAQITQALSRSVSLIPTREAEKFLLHDIWGHHWQLMLTQFGSDYAILAHCDEPLRAAETAYTAQGPLTCRELFQVQGDRICIDPHRASLFFHGEVEQRLGLLFTHLIGEMMADVAEFKFIQDHPHLADQLPSSSPLKAEPTKLDLGLSDIDFLFLRVLRPLLEIQLSALAESVLETELLADWGQMGYPVQSLTLRTSLKQAIAHLYQIFLEEYLASYLPTMAGEVGIYAQVVSNLLYLQNAVNSLCKNTTLASIAGIPFQALLLVFIGSYCSNDSYANFWEVDDAIARDFLPCWQVLQEVHPLL